MNILELAILKQMVGGGGGSGTDNYNDLSNLPQINGETLAGNKSSSNLGLQDEIDSDNKLASDLVDDENQENKFVTSTEKNTWNAKQNAIDSDHKLSSSLVSFSEAEAAAIASGIDSSKVGQISTNQTNILLVQNATEELVDNGAKNVLSWSLEEAKRINTDGTWSGNVYTHNGVTYTVNSDMTVNLSMVPGTTTHSRSVFKLSESVSNSYTNSYVLSSGNTYMSSDSFALYAEETDSPWTDIAIDYGTGTIISSTVQSVYSVYIAVKADYVLSITHTVKPMISTKAAWDVSHEYEQYAKSNAQLTRDCTVNNSRIYAQATEPTDIDIPEGSTWANGASVKGYERTDNLFDEKYTGITGATVGTTYYPIQVGTGDFTLSTTTPNSAGTGSLLFLLAGNVSEGASSSANGVHNGMSRTVTAVNGYVTVAYRCDNNYNPKNYQTMLNAGSSALPYVPYLEWQADPALVEQIDAGAKNLVDFSNLVSLVRQHATVTKTDTTVTVTSNDTWGYQSYLLDLPAGKYELSFNATAVSISSGRMFVAVFPGQTAEGHIVQVDVTSTGAKHGSFEWTGGELNISFYANPSNTQIINSMTITDVMICTEADWKVSQNYAPFALPNTDLTRMMTPFFTVPINHNMIYRGQNLGDTLTADQDTALSSGNFTDLYLGDYWTKQITIPAFYEVTAAEPADWSTNYTSYYTKSGDTYTPVTGDTAPTWAANTYYERLVPSQTVTLKAVIADFDTFYAGYASGYAAINSHHAAVIVHGFNNVVWNKTNTTAGGYVNSLIHKWLVNSALPQIETWFGSAKVLSHQKLLTNAITGDAASGWAWSSQKISLLSENQMYGSKVWGNSKATNGAYEPGEAFKHLNVFNHIDANLLFGNKNIWLRDIASAGGAALLYHYGGAFIDGASTTWVAPAALILLS